MEMINKTVCGQNIGQGVNNVDYILLKIFQSISLSLSLSLPPTPIFLEKKKDICTIKDFKIIVEYFHLKYTMVDAGRCM